MAGTATMVKMNINVCFYPPGGDGIFFDKTGRMRYNVSKNLTLKG